MRSLASLVLLAVALAQLLLLGASAGILAYRLREIAGEVARFGREEEMFLEQLAAVESDLYRIALLTRDSLASNPANAHPAVRELEEVLARGSVARLAPPSHVAAELGKEVEAIRRTWQDYLARARRITAWTDEERAASGRGYLAEQLVPTRERFITMVGELASLVRQIRRGRSLRIARSIASMQRLLGQVLAAAAVLGLALAAAAFWRFRGYEQDREAHLRRLELAEESLRALSQSLLEAQEQERKHLSRELHDEVGQLLTALRVQVGEATVQAGAGAVPHLRQAADLAERSLQTIRQLARGLRPAMLDDLGLGPALKWLCRDVERNSALQVEADLEDDLAGLDETRRTCIYRVAQEALTNCVKHSGARQVRVSLRSGPAGVILIVQDDGAGLAAGQARGLGLLGMRERVEEFGGTLETVSAPGEGLLIRATVPLPPPGAGREQPA